MDDKPYKEHATDAETRCHGASAGGTWLSVPARKLIARLFQAHQTGKDNKKSPSGAILASHRHHISNVLREQGTSPVHCELVAFRFAHVATNSGHRWSTCHFFVTGTPKTQAQNHPEAHRSLFVTMEGADSSSAVPERPKFYAAPVGSALFRVGA